MFASTHRFMFLLRAASLGLFVLLFQPLGFSQKYPSCTQSCSCDGDSTACRVPKPTDSTSPSVKYCSGETMEIAPSTIEVCAGQKVDSVLVRVPVNRMTKGDGI